MIPPAAKYLLFFQMLLDGSAAFSLLFDPKNAMSGPPMSNLTSLFNLPKPSESPDMQLVTLVAILTLSHALNYGISLLYGLDELAYITVPQRLIFAVIAIVAWYLDPSRGSASMILICVWDPLSAIALGFMIGSFSGRPPVAKKKVQKKRV